MFGIVSMSIWCLFELPNVSQWNRCIQSKACEIIFILIVQNFKEIKMDDQNKVRK